MEGYEDEASIFGCTTLRAILHRRKETGHTFTPAQMSSMLSAWATLSTGEREDTIIADLLSICHEQKTLDLCNVMQLSQAVSSLEKLKWTTNAEIMKAAGERLSVIVNTQLNQSSSKRLDPKIVNQILRCPVLLNRRNIDVMEPYIDAASKLFVDDRFLDSCRLGEFANFLWFMSVANLTNQDALTAIVRRILDPALVDACSPKLASRILGTYTSILAAASAQGDPFPYTVGEMTSQLFHDYGGHLLTTQLTPAEVSSTLYAYAKVSYVRDMGIYDHLVSSMASISKQCSVRQLTQGLWSCGKMIEWESMQFDPNKDNKAVTPPYLDHAYEIAVELAARANELSKVDVAQCIWALGRLEMCEHSVVLAFAKRAEKHVDSMNAVEISNVLWGLAKVGYHDRKSLLISTLSNKLTTLDSMNVSLKAAATALYALGKMEIRDEYVFDKLSQIMISHIDDASAQAVANALWAHKRVQLRPPKEMLNLWAIQKLGVTGLQFQNPNDIG
jgi:hypothetical protein